MDDYQFRLFDYNFYNAASNDSGDDESVGTNSTTFTIQMYGVNETGETCSIMVTDFKPFFYVLVPDSWNVMKKNYFVQHIQEKLGPYNFNNITDSKIIKRKKLYGFNDGKEYKFVKLEFSNSSAFDKAKNLWYKYSEDGYKLSPHGYKFNNEYLMIYESNIPALLRFFHIQDISPSGWISMPKNKVQCVVESDKKTHCTYEFETTTRNLFPLNNKETRVPYKICSFDIEASSSHGDFPVPAKTYKKLATNIIEYVENMKVPCTKELLSLMVMAAFGFGTLAGIDVIYTETPVTESGICKKIDKWVNESVSDLKVSVASDAAHRLEVLFAKINADQLNDVGFNKPDNNDDDNNDEAQTEYNDDYYSSKRTITKEVVSKIHTIVDVLCDSSVGRDIKLCELNKSLNCNFPKVEGDKVTFIGSTFMNYGEDEPSLNHCIVLDTCSKLSIKHNVVESYKTEKEVLLAWQRLIQRENPDIIIGYNIFGFDYPFMFSRAEQTDCVEEFLQLSRNKDEICATRDRDTDKWCLEECKLKIASGQHDIRYIKMNGRLQIDLFNFYRRESNLSSYKLDYVAGYFIGDFVKSIEDSCLIHTTNLTGLTVGSFIHFEEMGHSVDYYANGAKFLVLHIDNVAKSFKVSGIVNPDKSKKIRWGLAKDDVTPKDIFRLTNGSADDRGIVAKYCIQDCNLVHYLFNKSDVLTGYIEMANICSVPISFLVMRGQGIKLTSYIAKKCRAKRTLMPVIEKGGMDEGYEGAVVLDPKCDLYLDNPVACVDYASLYPSSMISENLSHDSKVWTVEYNLKGDLIKEWGDKDKSGKYLYDNLEGYEYVDISYDTYIYVRKTPSSTAKKVKVGTKTCRFAQFKEGNAIMPSILEELLKARKATRKLIPREKDEFMKQVLEQRQLGYKLTANSLYGQCGAKTSTFYEKDIAACTTAIGRKLLIYAKRVIEETYGNRICNTSHGKVLSKAEYIYGDTDSVFFTFNLHTVDGVPIRGKEALEITIELAQEAGSLASGCLKAPHDLEYEKTFMPFCLLSKKRYVGMLYETDPNKGKRKEMGIVLKRRDNAPIVKDIYGGIIDILMKEQDIGKAVTFLKNCLQNIVDEKYPMDKLIITKSLRSGYKKPNSIAHKVLADRIGERDPGSKPSSGDRIPYVFIHSKNKKALQGEKIETPTFIIDNKLKIDYSFYITNQIMNPVVQVFALVLENMWKSSGRLVKIKEFKTEVKRLKSTLDEETYLKKLEKLKEKEVKLLLFDDYLRTTNNKKEGNATINKWFTKKPANSLCVL